MEPNIELHNINYTLVKSLRSKFFAKVKCERPDFCQVDLDRVRNDDLWLGRFLAMKSQNVESALVRLYECCQWRKEYGTNDLVESDIPRYIHETGSFIIRGEDYDGKKVLRLIARNYARKKNEFELYKRASIYTLEKIEFESKSSQITVLLDLDECTYRNVDIKLLYHFATTVKRYYPFLIKCIIVYNTPWYLSGVVAIVKSWLPQRFLYRLKFVDKGTVGEFLSPENLPEYCGGKDSFIFKYIPQKNPKPLRKSSRDSNFNKIIK